MYSIYHDYGYASKLGQFFIPRVMQQNSKFKPYANEEITLVKCIAYEDDYILLTYYERIAIEVYYALKTNKDLRDKGILAIDELGRVLFPKKLRTQFKFYQNTGLKSYLMDECTIRIDVIGAAID